MVLVLLIVGVVSHAGAGTDRVWPLPRNITSDPEAAPYVVNPCDIKLVIETPSVHVK